MPIFLPPQSELMTSSAVARASSPAGRFVKEGACRAGHGPSGKGSCGTLKNPPTRVADGARAFWSAEGACGSAGLEVSSLASADPIAAAAAICRSTKITRGHPFITCMPPGSLAGHSQTSAYHPARHSEDYANIFTAR